MRATSFASTCVQSRTRSNSIESNTGKHELANAGPEQESCVARETKPFAPWAAVLHDLESKDCPRCGKDCTEERLDIIPAKLFVRRHVRPNYCCRRCETLHIAAMICSATLILWPTLLWERKFIPAPSVAMLSQTLIVGDQRPDSISCRRDSR